MSSNIVLRADARELERLSQWIAQLVEAHRLAPRLASHVDLCLTEIATNIISHAYEKTTPPPEAVIVNFVLQGAQIVVQIEDRGVAFDPVSHVLPPLPTSLADAGVGGSGLRLVRKFADRLDYHRADGVNRLAMVFLC